MIRSEGDGKAEVAEDGRGSEGEDEAIVEELVEEWSNRLGPKYVVKVRTLYIEMCKLINIPCLFK